MTLKGSASSTAMKMVRMSFRVSVICSAGLKDWGFAAGLVSVGVRLIPLGQSDGQRVLAALEALVTKTAARVLATPLDEVGGSAMRADLASMHHETQYTRLFRS